MLIAHSLRSALALGLTLLITLAGVLMIGVPAVLAQGSGDLPPITPSKSRTPTKSRTPGKGKTAPKPTAETKPSTLLRAPAQVLPLTYNQAVNSTLDAQNSGRIASGHYYNEYALMAKASELVTIQFQPDAPTLAMQVAQAGQPDFILVKDAMTGDYKFDTPNGTPPADGEYRLRIINLSAEKAPTGSYTLKVTRNGITAEAYQARLQSIALNFNASEAASLATTIQQLETLVSEDNGKAGAPELLGTIYATHRGDLQKAEQYFEHALRLGGAAQFRVSFDPQWRKARKVGQAYEWEEPKTAWLRILADGRVQLTDPNSSSHTAATSLANHYVFTLPGTQVRNVERTSSTSPIIVVNALPRRTYQFMPSSKNAAEADLIIKLLQVYVQKRPR